MHGQVQDVAERGIASLPVQLDAVGDSGDGEKGFIAIPAERRE